MAWLPGFSNRLKLTIPPDNIDSNQTDFPVMIYLSTDSGLNNYDASAVFDELDDDHQRYIAVTTNDEVTQCPVEIEYWDSTEEKAILWTKIPTVYSTVDTDMYLYFDATYSGTTASGIGTLTTASGNIAYVGDTRDLNSQMVVDIASEGTYDINRVFYPCVIKDGSTYKMWYSGRDASNVYRILYTTSTDGISWTGHQMVVDINQEMTYDTVHVYHPYVIKDGSTYKMWYSGRGSNYRVMYATSTNGTTWSNYQMVVDIGSEGTYDTTYSYQPCVIKESDNSYKMWYNGHDGSNARIIYAISDSGTTWSGHQMVVNIGAEGVYDTVHATAPCVLKEGSIYRMWYTGYTEADVSGAYRGVYATSIDGVVWGNFERNFPLGLNGQYDSTYTGLGPSVINDNGEYKIWYSGYASPSYRILYTSCWLSPATNVWSSEYVTVAHMNTDPSDGLYCSTLDGDHGISIGTMTPADLVDGRFGKVIEFDGIDDAIRFGSSSSPPATYVEDDFTYTCWVKASATHEIDTQSDSGIAGASGQRYAVAPIGWGGAGLSVGTNGASVYVHNDSYVPPLAVYDATIGSDWNHIAVVFTTKVPTIYLNGVAVHTGVAYTSAYQYSAFSLGAYSTWGSFVGQIDQFQSINTNKSAAFIKASYHNESDNLIVFQDDIPAGWLSDWAKRIELTIDYNKIDTTLDEFPVCLTLTSGTNAADVFSELYTVSGTRKIAVTTYNGTTQCPVEIQQWSWEDEEAILWTKVPVVDADADTTLYLYYDNTKSDNTSYVGNSGDLVARDVWDENFIGVYHLGQDPMAGGSSVINSAASSDHGTPTGFTNWRSDGSIIVDEQTAASSSLWSEVHVATGESNWITFERVECVELVCYTAADAARIFRSGAGAVAGQDRVVVTFRAYFDEIQDVSTGFRMSIRDTDVRCEISWGDDGVAVHDGATFVTIGGSSGWFVEDAWYTWTLDIDFSTPASAAVNIYLNGELKSSSVDCSYTGSWPSGQVSFSLYTTSSARVYFDFLHIGTQFGTGTDLVEGKIGEAVQFDRYNDYITFGDAFYSDALTVETVVKPLSFDTGAYRTIAVKRNIGTANQASQAEWYLYFYSDAPRFLVFDTAQTQYTAVDPDSILSNTWYYVAGTTTGEGGEVNIYTDGVAKDLTPASQTNATHNSTNEIQLGCRSVNQDSRYFDGIIDEFRLSNVARSASWVKATYYSNWNELITFSAPESMPIDPTHYYYGYVTVDDVPAARTVRVYNRDTGALMSSTTSNAGTGYYYLTTTVSGEHYVVTLDDEYDLDYNALILDKLLPRGIE